MGTFLLLCASFFIGITSLEGVDAYDRTTRGRVGLRGVVAANHGNGNVLHADGLRRRALQSKSSSKSKSMSEKSSSNKSKSKSTSEKSKSDNKSMRNKSMRNKSKSK